MKRTQLRAIRGLAAQVPHRERETSMDVPREGAEKKDLIRRIIAGVIVLGVAGSVTFRLSKLQPAAVPVEFSTVWPDTVKRGPMLRDVRAFLPR